MDHLDGCAGMTQAIIIMEQTGLPSDLNYKVLFWLDVPSARQPYYAKRQAAAVSAYPFAIQAEIDAIRAGQIVEVVEPIPRVAGTPLATVKQAARDRLTALQSDLNANNPYNRYGTRWTQGVGWVDVTVA